MSHEGRYHYTHYTESVQIGNATYITPTEFVDRLVYEVGLTKKQARAAVNYHYSKGDVLAFALSPTFNVHHEKDVESVIDRQKELHQQRVWRNVWEMYGPNDGTPCPYIISRRSRS